MEIYMTRETRKNLEDIYNFAYQKYRKGEVKKRPTKAMIVRKLINDLHEVMVEDGQL